MINDSDIVPPPIGTAVISKTATSDTKTIWKIDTSPPNRLIKNMILNTHPIIDPSWCKLVPKPTKVSETSSGIPIFLAASIFTGKLAAEEQVAKEVNVGSKIFDQKALTAFLPPAINAYKL